MVQNNIIKAISALLCFAVLFSGSMVYAGANTQPDAKGNAMIVNSLSPEESNVVFCDECTKIINEHLKDHH